MQPGAVVTAVQQGELLRYTRALRRHKWMIIVPAYVAVLVALGLSALQTPLYRASAEVLLRPSRTDSALSEEVRPAVVQTEIRVLQSASVRALAAELAGTASAVSAAAIPETAVILVSAERDSAEEAARVVNAHVNAYIEFRQREVANDIAAAEEALADVEDRIAGLEEPDPAAAGGVTGELMDEASLLRERLVALRTGALVGTGGPQLITPAVPPTEPISPAVMRNVFLALATALVLGVGLAVLSDRLDDTIGTPHDLASTAPELPLLGVLDRGTRAIEAVPVDNAEPGSSVAEAYRFLQTSLGFLGGNPIRTLLITSAGGGASQTSVVANLATSLAQAGHRVIVVALDPHRPELQHVLGSPGSPGLSDVLSGAAPLEIAVQDAPGAPGVRVLGPGAASGRTPEGSGAASLVELFATLEGQADVVLLDSPPVLAVADAVALAAQRYPTLLVIDAGETTRKSLNTALEHLRRVDAVLVGAVLTSGAPGDSGFQGRMLASLKRRAVSAGSSEHDARRVNSPVPM